MNDTLRYVLNVYANVGIGVTSLVVPLSLLWLYSHRRSAWPKSWVMVIVSIFLGALGTARLLMAVNPDTSIILGLTLLAATDGLIGACLIPWAVWIISKFPTPDEIKRNAEQAQVAIYAAAETVRMAHEKEIAENREKETQRRMEELKALLDHAITDPNIRSKAIALVERGNNGGR